MIVRNARELWGRGEPSSASDDAKRAFVSRKSNRVSQRCRIRKPHFAAPMLKDLNRQGGRSSRPRMWLEDAKSLSDVNSTGVSWLTFPPIGATARSLRGWIGARSGMRGPLGTLADRVTQLQCFARPASTWATRFSRSILRMRFIFVVETMTPESKARTRP